MTVRSTGQPGTLNATNDLVVNATNSGVVGNVTINNNSGRCNIAAAGSTVVVTNNKCTTASRVFVNLQTVDGTAKSVQATSANGSFTATLNAAATGQVAIDFLVVN